MKKLKTKELRKKTPEELDEMIKDLSFSLSITYGKLKQEKQKHIRSNIRRNIAQLKTILNERKIKWKK